MTRPQLARSVAACCAALVALGPAAACSGGILGNRGGDTTCADFLSQDEEAQRETIRVYLEEREGNEPINLEIATTRVIIVGYCTTFARDSDPIRSIEG
ncbi:hypothetical protein HT102_02475 [Hoyosella sp. G463]|uniref:Uncharacterized protein n=1 Tax=Lolliginicoccus lacisalsi TaxID=2742202 RepID=A0A927PK62_9ACTN|nr:hypothetical protein [Lolliginicoccus lacisalsi]MBD8505353.1 hypothetical protein [Lolliginicoccus lacisalsi]